MHREGRPLTSAGSVPCSGDGPCSSFSRVGQLSQSNAFSVPDRNVTSIVEQGGGWPPCASCSTSDVLGRDWSEVASELPGRSKQQCKERYRFADTVAELTFVFLRVIFRGSPAFRSSLVLSKV